MGELQPELAGPIELLDLEHGNSITLGIDRYESGFTTIIPRTVTKRHLHIHMKQNGLTAPPPADHPITNQIPIVRVFGDRIDSPSPLHYWDISSLTLQADLLPRLIANAGHRLVVTLTANGQKPTKRYSIEQG